MRMTSAAEPIDICSRVRKVAYMIPPRRANGAALRVIREALGVTRADLAAAASRSVSWLSHVEAGDYQPSPAALAAIARHLGVPLAAITATTDDEVAA